MYGHVRVRLGTNGFRAADGNPTRYWVARWTAAGRERARNIGYKLAPAARRSEQIGSRKAKRLAKRLEVELNANPGRAALIGTAALGPYADAYLTSRRADCAATTVVLMRSVLRRFRAYVGDTRRLDHVTRTEARAWVQSMTDEGLAPATARKHAMIVSGLYRRACEDGLCESNPFFRIGGRRSDAAAWRYVPVDELERVLAHCTNGRAAMVLRLCRLAALRLSEAVGARWDSIDWQQRMLTVTGKGGKLRAVPLCPEILAAVRQMPRTFDHADTICGTSPGRKGELFYLDRWCAAAGVRPWAKVTHDLRKSCLTDWADRFPIHVVKRWAGHSSIATTEKFYLAVPDAHARNLSGLSERDSTGPGILEGGKTLCR